MRAGTRDPKTSRQSCLSHRFPTLPTGCPAGPSAPGLGPVQLPRLPSLLLTCLFFRRLAAAGKPFPRRAASEEAHQGSPYTLSPPPACFLCVLTLCSTGHLLTKPCFFLLNICFLWSIFPHCVSLEIKEFPIFHSLLRVQILGNALS